MVPMDRKIQAQTSFSAGLVRLQGRVRVIISTFLYLGTICHPRRYKCVILTRVEEKVSADICNPALRQPLAHIQTWTIISREPDERYKILQGSLYPTQIL
jgi:hypothetical protein